MYGFAAYYSDHWPTRDKVIPFKLFLLLSGAIRHLSSETELRMAHAQAFGAALASGDRSVKRKMEQYTRRLVEDAYPEVIEE